MKQNLKTIDIDNVDSLESYLLNLGILCVSVNTLMNLQTHAERLGIFDDDETEISKTIGYQSQRLFTIVNDMLGLVCKRTNIEWTDMLMNVIKTIGKPPQKKPPKKRAKKIAK